MKKSILLLLIVLIASALVFTSCGGNDPSNPAGGGGTPGGGGSNLGLDGTWIFTMHYDADPDEGTCAIDLPTIKLVINGSSYQLLMPTDESTYAIYEWACLQNGSQPSVEWETEPDEEGTISKNGNELTFTDGDGETMSATVNGNTITAENNDYDPDDIDDVQYMDFIKQ